MTSVFDNMWTLWTWPMQAARFASDAIDTMLGAQRVVAARLPVIGSAMVNPATANHDELTRMVSEKITAFGISGRALTSAGKVVRDTGGGGIRLLDGLFKGRPISPGDWWKLAEQNLAAAATLVALPGAALAPIRRGVAGNDRRLRK